MDPAQFYDDLASYYDLIFEDWEASMVRQGNAIAALLTRSLPDQTKAIAVLDVAAGIGTQSLPLAKQGMSVTSRDLSSAAILRLQTEATRRGVAIEAAVADMRAVSASIAHPVDAVIAFDNSVPHLLTDDEIRRPAPG